MAWSNSKQVGNWGSRLIVDVTLNSQSGNSSNITVRIRLKNGGSSTAFDNNGTSWSMSNGVSASGSDTFSIGAGSTGTLASRSFTVAHNANGTKSLTVTVNVGNTSTSTFGTPGSLSVSFTLPRIAKAPSKPSKPSISNVTNNSLVGNLTQTPANNGATIIEYGWELRGGHSTTGTGTARSWPVVGLFANTGYSVRVRARNSVGWGAWSDWSATVTTKPNAPTAPTNVAVSRVNDNRQTIAWSNNSTTQAPYTSIRIQSRWSTVSGQWSTWGIIATISGSATSYTDTTTVAGRRYEYYVQSVNSAGMTLSAPVGVNTTPLAPTNVTAVKSGANINVSWTRVSQFYGVRNHIVQARSNGGTWANVATVGDVGQWAHPSPDPARTWQYRVAARSTETPTLTSPFSGGSNVVQLAAPPLAPTLDAPTGTLNRDADVAFRWTHNPVDTTAQSEYELRYRLNGGSWTTLTGTTASTRTVTALGVSGIVEWQARTKGEHASFGPWAAVKTFTLGALPAATINSPTDPVLHGSTLTLEWAYSNVDSSPQSQWQAELLDNDGAMIESRAGTGADVNTTFARSLTDSATYTARVRARSGAGLWSEWDSTTFVTDFPSPAKVDVFAEWDAGTGSVMLTFEVRDPVGDETAPDFIDVQRDDGTGWVTIAAGIDPETSIVDYTPRLGEVRYRAISRTSLPSAQIGDESVIEWSHGGRDPVFVNGGTDFEVVRAAIGHEVTDSPGVEQAAHEWAGWNKPTAVFGEGQSYAVQFQANIFPHIPNLDGRSSREEWHDLLLQRGVICYRDCAGRKIFGLLGLSFQTASSVTRLSLTVEETHFDEGVAEVLPVPDEGGN